MKQLEFLKNRCHCLGFFQVEGQEVFEFGLGVGVETAEFHVEDLSVRGGQGWIEVTGAYFEAQKVPVLVSA